MHLRSNAAMKAYAIMCLLACGLGCQGQKGADDLGLSTDAGGTISVQLPVDPDAVQFGPTSMSADGDHVLLWASEDNLESSMREGPPRRRYWLLNQKEREVKPLSGVVGERHVVVRLSPDGKWVFIDEKTPDGERSRIRLRSTSPGGAEHVLCEGAGEAGGACLGQDVGVCVRGQGDEVVCSVFGTDGDRKDTFSAPGVPRAVSGDGSALVLDRRVGFGESEADGPGTALFA